MNTIAFGEEIVAEDVAADEVVTEEVVNDDVAEVPEEAAVEEAGEAALDEAELEDASLAAVDHYGRTNGIGYDKEGKAVTKITYASNEEKKNPVNSVVTITDTTDPVSWNNFYGKNLIHTVVAGTDKEDSYLNNDAKIEVSENTPITATQGNTPEGLRAADPIADCRVIEIEDGVYLLVEYSLDNALFVKGHDAVVGSDKAPLPLWATVRNEQLPVTYWDGRKVVWNKSGDGNETKSNYEGLDVKASLVKYDNGTVTELNGVTVGSVKIDAKAIKQASVALASAPAKVTGKYIDTGDNNKEKDVTEYIDEHDTINTLPTFTITVKAKGKDAKKYNKGIKTALKDKKFEFGIVQAGVYVEDPTNGKIEDVYEKIDPNTNLPVHFGVERDADTNDIKAYKVTTASSNDAKEMAPEIAKKYLETNSGYVSADKKNPVDIGGIMITGFKKDKATLVNRVNIIKNGVVTGTADIALKEKTDYTLEKGSLAGEDVYALEFKEGGNYTYLKALPKAYDNNDDECDYDDANLNELEVDDLSFFGYKWAFRMSPVEKSKDFRLGAYVESNVGFVYDAE